MRLPGRASLPESLRARLTLGRGDRALAWAAYDADGVPGHLVATTRGLHDVTAAGDRLLHWDEVENARWHDGRLDVTRLGRPGRLRWLLDDPGSVPEVVRDRVTASIVVSTAHRLSIGDGVRIVGRRRPGEPGLRWYVVFDRPEHADDPLLRAEADEWLQSAKASVGE
jgi:hypothetical protein